MNRNILVAAIEAAIAGGAVAIPPVVPLGGDDNAIRAAVDVGMEAATADAYLAALKQDPDFARFDDNMFANIPHGGGVSTSAAALARPLLAQAIGTGDIDGTVTRFIEYVTANAVPAIAVYGVSGIRVAAPVSLGPDVQLLPMTAVPPSPQRGSALGQGPGILPGLFRGPIPTALVTKFIYKPVFYEPQNPQPPADMAAKIPTQAAKVLLEEAASLLGLVGTPATYRMFWVQPADWLVAGGINAGWQYSSAESLGNDALVSPEIAGTAAAYFAIEQKTRSKFLRIPLDRLNRAIQERDFADKVIDLGILLEALLLHDSGNPADRGELKFRMALRGAWLMGNDPAQRQSNLVSLAKLYDLRSRAVHSGLIERNADTAAVIQCASELSAALIQRMVELNCKVDWTSLVSGGPAQPAPAGP